MQALLVSSKSGRNRVLRPCSTTFCLHLSSILSMCGATTATASNQYRLRFVMRMHRLRLVDALNDFGTHNYPSQPWVTDFLATKTALRYDTYSN